MRLAMTLVVFLIVGVTVAGAAITVLLAGPFSTQEVIDLFGWVAAAGFLVSLPISYVIAGNLMKRMNSAQT